MTQTIVIARGFGGEPKRLVAKAVEDGRVLVGVTEEDAGEEAVDNVVSLPRSNVFSFDAALFDRLTTEWEVMGQTEAETWRALKPFGARALADA